MATTFALLCFWSTDLSAAPRCDLEIAKLGFYEKLQAASSSLLAPTIAQFTLDLRKAWIQALFDPNHYPFHLDVELRGSLKLNVLEALDRGIESCVIFNQRLVNHASGAILAPLAKSNLESLTAIKVKLEISQKVTYLDYNNILTLITQRYHDGKVLRERGESHGLKQEFFKVSVPLVSERDGHLGFRKLNDWSAAGIGPVEFPAVDARLVVDGNNYDFGAFVAHDDGHTSAQFVHMYRDVLDASEGLGDKSSFVGYEKVNSLNDIKLVELFVNHLKLRSERYRKVRRYIDSITDKKKRLLAEGYWFYLGHELNVAYSSQNRIDEALRGLRVFGETRFESFDDFALPRFRSQGDLGQAFKDPSWITVKELKEVRKGLEAATGLRFNI